MRTLALSPNGQRIASESNDSIKIWDLSTRRELRTITRTDNGYGYTSVIWSADGNRVIDIDDKTVKIWNALNGQVVRTLSGHTEDVDAVAMSRDGRRIASISKDRLVVWNADTGGKIVEFSGTYAFDLCFSADGKRLFISPVLSLSATTIKVIDLDTRREIQGITAGASIVSVRLNPSGNQLFAGDSVGGRIFIYDANTGRLIRTVTGGGERDYYSSIVFSPDGRYMCTGGNQVTIWNLATGQQTKVIGEYGAHAVYSLDGKNLYVASRDVIKILDTQTWAEQ
jgi:WD40 repeat protein